MIWLSRSLVVLGAIATVVGLAWDLAWNSPVDFGPFQIALIAVGACSVFAGTIWLGVGRRAGAPTTPEAVAPSPTHALPRRFLPRVGLWLGLLTGLAEAAHLVRSEDSFWPHALWLGPVVYGLLFASIGAGAAIGRDSVASSARFRATIVSTFALTFVAWLSLLAPRLHVIASVVLSIGLAWQAANLLVRRTRLVEVVVRRTEAILVAIVVTIALGAFWGGIHAERAALRSLPPAASGVRNVILLVLDTVRARSLSLLGYARETTPNLERWAERGVVFERAMSTAPWTLPSHAGMFTGRWAHETTADWNAPLDGTHPTLAEVLSDRGYVTAGFVGNLAYTSRASGLARGFARYDDYQIGFWQAVLETSLGRTIVTGDWLRNAIGHHQLLARKDASEIDADFLDWLDRRPARPFFAFVNYYDAHEPYMPPAPYRDLFRPGIPEPRGPYNHQVEQADRSDWWEMTPEEVAHEQALYDASIAYLDHEIGTLLEELDERELLDSAVVIVTSDHGEQFGGHGLFMHGNSLYLDELHVPLLILLPNHLRPTRVKELVSLRDLPNTILDAAGAGPSAFPGASLAPSWEGEPRTAAADTFFFSVSGGFGPPQTPLAKGDIWSLMADPYQYILNGDGTEELYDNRTDPDQMRNLSTAPTSVTPLDQFRTSTSAHRPRGR